MTRRSSSSDSNSGSRQGVKNDTSGIYIGVVRRQNGKRVRDKKLSCFVCGEKVLWLSRHLETQHPENSLVAQVMTRTDKARQNGLKCLKNLGSFKHNVRVLQKGKGELIVVRRSTGQHGPESYLPCTQCFGFYYIYDLWRHKCPHKNNDDSYETTSKDVMDSSRSLLEGAVGDDLANRLDKYLKKHVLNHMRMDKYLALVKTDTLILRFGSAQLKRIGVKGRRRIAVRMRMLARLLWHLRRAVDLPCKTLSDFLDNIYFDAFIEVVEALCGLHTDDTGHRYLATPSLSLMIGNILPKCCQIKKGMAIRRGDDEQVKQVDRFMDLFKLEYANALSCPALTTLKTRHYNKLDELPSTEDLIKLKSYTDEQISSLTNLLKCESSYNSWRSLSEVVLVRLLVFNKRRASEPAKLELLQYVNRPDWKSASNRELIDNLKPVEKLLLDRMDMVQVPGKRNRRVPILITPEVGEAMKLLVMKRSSCGVSPCNKYFFATDSQDGYLNTWLVLHNHAVAAGVEKPRLITSSRLRKYIATLAQVEVYF